jgi:hypothetical protein
MCQLVMRSAASHLLVTQEAEYFADHPHDDLGFAAGYLPDRHSRLWLDAGEEICLDRWPWWGPPENADVYSACSGHNMRAASEAGLSFAPPVSNLLLIHGDERFPASIAAACNAIF